ncbi:MAG TPA: hypothetical protein VGB07_22390 [Blastocatellia bacterium]
MTDDRLGDWRIQAATRLAADVPSAFPGGPSHKTGTPVYLVTTTTNPKKQPVSFVTPSAVALALSVAMRVSVEAESLASKLQFEEVVTPTGKGKSVKNQDLGLLYDYFEHCMIAVTFSFQALETYCNHVIVDKLKYNFSLQRRDGIKSFTPAELERGVSTEEKLSVVLPSLLGVGTPKGKKVWQDFVTLKRARDSTIHLKSSDQYPNTPPTNIVDEENLFFQFLNKKPKDFPKSAIHLIKYFLDQKELPRWFQNPVEFLTL